MANCAILGCNQEQGGSFHYLPKDQTLKIKWLDFIHKNRLAVSDFIDGIRICSAHFSQDRFHNLVQKQMGFANKLILKPDAVPTIYPGSHGATGASESQDVKPLFSCPQFSHACCQTDADAPHTTTVGTQLSMSTLKNPYRSRACQTDITVKEGGGTPSIHQKALEQLFSSTVMKARPAKRPRLKLEENDCFQPDPYHSVDPVTGLSKSTPLFGEEPRAGPLSDLPKYLINENCLFELFEVCPVCQSRCDVSTKRIGTSLAVDQLCPHCQYSRKWSSQPMTESATVGNVQLTAAVYFTVPSLSKERSIEKAVPSDDSHSSSPHEPFITSEIVVTVNEEDCDSSDNGEEQVGVELESKEMEDVEEEEEEEEAEEADTGMLKDSDTDYNPGEECGFPEDYDFDEQNIKGRGLCPECGMFFNNPKTHMCQFKVKPHSCNLCGKRFVNESALKIHSKKHEDGNEHQCQFCFAILKTRPDKMAHEETHYSSENPYQCSQCPETFPNINSRSRHMRVHAICHICNVHFRKCYLLRRHMAVHTGVKPFVCDVCQRSFNQESHLKSHMRLHTGEKPFKCLHCDKSFNHNVSLKSHIQRYHQVPGFGSELCEADKDDLNHGDEENTKDTTLLKKRTTGRPKKNAEVSGGNLDIEVPAE